MLLWYTIEELMEFRKNKIAYLSDPWNILDWINLIIFYVVVGRGFPSSTALLNLGRILGGIFD